MFEQLAVFLLKPTKPTASKFFCPTTLLNNQAEEVAEDLSSSNYPSRTRTLKRVVFQDGGSTHATQADVLMGRCTSEAGWTFQMKSYSVFILFCPTHWRTVWSLTLLPDSTKSWSHFPLQGRFLLGVCSPNVCVGSSQVLQLPPTICRHATPSRR